MIHRFSDMVRGRQQSTIVIVAAAFCAVASGGAGNVGGGDAAVVSRRMEIFERAVCDKCATRGVECGCSGDANPPFDLLHSYARQYQRWRKAAAQRGVLPAGGVVLVAVEGGAGNQQIHVIGALMLALSLGRPLVLRHNTPLSFPFDPVIDWFDFDALMAQGILPADVSEKAFLLDVFSEAGVQMLSSGDLQAELSGYPFVKFQGAYGIHVALINPHSGAWLAKAFHDLPFFVLSHFLWSGRVQRELEPVRIVSRPPQPWDKEYVGLQAFQQAFRSRVGDLLVQGSEVVTVGVHVRTDTNHPMYYFDQSHVLPHAPEDFCGGEIRSLEAYDND